MTTMTMTADAQRLYDRYLQTVRWSIRGIADANEIESDVREHVASALHGEQGPVTSDTLREVLSRLGDPWQWVPIEELPLWRRTLMRFWLGPDDWRLAYLCFGLTMLGLVLLPVGIGFFLLIGAYFVARATHEIASDRDGSVGARRWLVYPPLAMFSALVLFSLVMGPAAPAVGWGIGEGGFRLIFDDSHFRMSDPLQNATFYASAAAIAAGTWWIMLSAIVALAVRPLRWLFTPFAAGLRRVHALWLTGAGVAAVATGAAVLLLH
jgi:hypothetical protein